MRHDSSCDHQKANADVAAPSSPAIRCSVVCIPSRACGFLDGMSGMARLTATGDATAADLLPSSTMRSQDNGLRSTSRPEGENRIGQDIENVHDLHDL